MNKVISKDGTTIAYDKKGQGPVLIQVLGALNRRSQGKKLAKLLCDRFTVVSYDRRGRGDSTNTLPYSISREIEDIKAILDELGGEAYMYGHSSGCILALRAAKELNITSLALYELPYNADASAQKVSQDYRNELAKLLSEDKRGDAVTLFVKSVGVSDKQIAAMERLPMWKGLTAMAHTLTYDTIELMEEYPRLDTKSISIKTLVMYGSKSPEFMGKTAQQLIHTMKNGELRMLDGQAHDVKADALAPVLADFFQIT